MEEITPLITFALRSAMLYEEIRREGSRLGSIINSMPEGLLMVDQDFRVILSNDSYEKLWGLGIRVPTGTRQVPLFQVRWKSSMRQRWA